MREKKEKYMECMTRERTKNCVFVRISRVAKLSHNFRGLRERESEGFFLVHSVLMRAFKPRK